MINKTYYIEHNGEDRYKIEFEDNETFLSRCDWRDNEDQTNGSITIWIGFSGYSFAIIDETIQWEEIPEDEVRAFLRDDYDFLKQEAEKCLRKAKMVAFE